MLCRSRATSLLFQHTFIKTVTITKTVTKISPKNPKRWSSTRLFQSACPQAPSTRGDARLSRAVYGWDATLPRDFKFGNTAVSRLFPRFYRAATVLVQRPRCIQCVRKWTSNRPAAGGTTAARPAARLTKSPRVYRCRAVEDDSFLSLLYRFYLDKIFIIHPLSR